MSKLLKIIIAIGLLGQNSVKGQSVLNIYPDSLIAPVNENFSPGCFFSPKTLQAYNDFMGNGIFQNVIRTNAIESALNNSTDLTSCLSLLSSYQADLMALSLRCDKFIFIFEKMPLWLSSSTDGTPVTGIAGYYVFNTKPPANWNTWQTVIDSITAKIVNQFGITNAYFEIWNEPDLGSWTGTMNEYFTLYKRTYDGVKSANPSAKVGGPTVNFWANNLNWQPPYGYISNTKADSSLIGQLLDSVVIWNKIPDFISWHNFNISYQEFTNAANYIQQKLTSLFLPAIPLIITEWNAPSAIRDTRLATPYMIKVQIELSKTVIANNSIAAWQDFNSSTTEFHNDYGLLTYGAIHKPAYNSILLSDKIDGTTCKMTSISPYDGVSSVINDTLFVLISNYCPPPFVEAFNYTLYQGQFNVNQLDSAGYIDIVGNSVLHLDSIYKGLIIIPNSNVMQIAINNSIGIYQHYDSIATSPRQFNLNISGYSGSYSGQLFMVDSTQNNMQFKYDSLLTAGYTQPSAISAILPNQNINFSTISVNAGQYSFSLQPNAVCLFKIGIPGINSITGNNFTKNNFVVYPNPGSESLTIVLTLQQVNTETMLIYNSMGALVKTVHINQPATVIDVSELSSGLYFIQLKNNQQQTTKFIKQ
ncbi:MAG: T9SS type A sorting domain-containing protein [Bacteroidetes bacterium]|nr:T9SS type A sorting domain-containing protein [Bacteroidota bacterium]